MLCDMNDIVKIYILGSFSRVLNTRQRNKRNVLSSERMEIFVV